jgi:hypothetical protein
MVYPAGKGTVIKKILARTDAKAKNEELVQKASKVKKMVCRDI